MRNIWEKWKILAEKIGNFQATVVFSILYFVLVTPVGIIASLFSDSLSTKIFPVWQKTEDNTSVLERMKNQ